MFLMTPTLFPAPETNKREIHIWDPLPARPFPPPPGTEPRLCAVTEAAQVASGAQRRPPAHLGIADGFLREQTPELHMNPSRNVSSRQLGKGAPVRGDRLCKGPEARGSGVVGEQRRGWIGGGQGMGPSQARPRAGICFPLGWHGRSWSGGGAESALCDQQLHGQSLRWLDSARESRTQPGGQLPSWQLLSEEVTSEVGLEGQKEDLAMTRKAEGWGLCPRVLRALR